MEQADDKSRHENEPSIHALVEYYQSLRLRLSPWQAFALAGIFIVWAFVDKKGAVTLRDLYPGLGLLSAGLLLLGYLSYVKKKASNERRADDSAQSSHTSAKS
jgi:hypothetical protein